MSAAPIPLTISNGLAPNFSNRIVVGKEMHHPTEATLNSYWAVVLNRSDLSVVVNFTFQDNADVPPLLMPSAGNDSYILILTTIALNTSNLPVGDLYNFLVKYGSGTELKKLEQIYAALDSSMVGTMGYTMVAVFDDTEGIEFSDIHNKFMISTLQLMPVSIGSQTLYTPVSLQ